MDEAELPHASRRRDRERDACRRVVQDAPEGPARTVAVRDGNEDDVRAATGNPERARSIGRHDGILIRNSNTRQASLVGVAFAVTVRVDVDAAADPLRTCRGESSGEQRTGKTQGLCHESALLSVKIKGMAGTEIKIHLG